MPRWTGIPAPSGFKWKKKATHCNRGHEFTADNTGWNIRPTTRGEKDSARVTKARFCKACHALKHIERRARPGDTERRTQAMRDWRAANPERNNKNWRENRKTKKAWLDAQKTVCCRCQETHPACLEFHHRDPKQKEMLLSLAIARYSLDRIKAEVAKCDVVCSNCHRKLHWEERQKKLKTE